MTVTATDGPSHVVRTVQQPVTPLPLNVVDLRGRHARGPAIMSPAGINNPSFDPFFMSFFLGDGVSVASRLPVRRVTVPVLVHASTRRARPRALRLLEPVPASSGSASTCRVFDDPLGPSDVRTVAFSVRKTDDRDHSDSAFDDGDDLERRPHHSPSTPVSSEIGTGEDLVVTGRRQPRPGPR